MSRRAVCTAGSQEHWPERVERIEREAQEKAEREHIESLAEIRRRHLATARAMSARALAGLKEFPLTDGMQAIKAADLTIRLERLLMDEATERVYLDIAALTRGEIDEMLVAEDGADDSDDGGSEEHETPATE
jgi:hypothetical protein